MAKDDKPEEMAAEDMTPHVASPGEEESVAATEAAEKEDDKKD